MQASGRISTKEEDAGHDIGPDADDLRLVAEILGHHADPEGLVLLFRRDRLFREARVRIPECFELPRYVSCTDWDHRFPEGEREVKTRWVFDRRLWSVVVLHVRGAGGVWLGGVPHELLDVTESLVLANSDALHDVRGWGCVEGLALPNWTADATANGSALLRRVR